MKQRSTIQPTRPGHKFDVTAAVDAVDPETRMDWEERAAIREYDGGFSREEAERKAYFDVMRKGK